MTPNQFKNLLAFLCLAGNEDCHAFLDKSPPYLVEKFSRYGSVAAMRGDDGWNRGLHPVLRRQFDRYVELWKIDTRTVIGEN